jgi:ATP-dependent Clp protease ATP-binding subunit ClpA
LPKVNVYLPDDLAESVRAASLPISAICQAALRDALRQAIIRQETIVERTLKLPDKVELSLPVTHHVVAALMLAYPAAASRQRSTVDTEHILLGVLDEGENLALRVIETLEIDPLDVKAELEASLPTAPPRKSKARPRLSAAGRSIIQAANAEASRMARPFVGCEHLLLALLADQRGLAGKTLRRMGLEMTTTRSTVLAALSGSAYGRGSTAAQSLTLEKTLLNIDDRLLRIENVLAVTKGVS